MVMNKWSCNGELQMLLSGDENSDEYRRLAEHVDTCIHCQQSLTQLAGEQQTWTEVSQLLVGYQDLADSDAAISDREDADVALNLDFLSAPSHPEMLGRLGRYEIERVIGAGGMGIVLKGFDGELNRPVAIKVLAPHLCSSGAARKRFEREARAAAAVVHEHIVAIHNVESDGRTPFIVMQYVPGESLQARVDREGPLPAAEILRIGMQAAAGLSAAHEQGVIHRDIKPANILLENDVDRALVTDFGLARSVDDASLTQTGVIAGTPQYMSPEQATSEVIDHRSDLFSLGSVLYFMATGRPPFRADKAMGVLHRICHDQHRPACDVNRGLPLDLSDTIDQLLEKKPANRIGQAANLRKQLSELLAEIQEGRRPGWRDATRRLFRRQRLNCYRAMAATGAALLVGLLALTLGRTAFYSSNANPLPNGAPAASSRIESGTQLPLLGPGDSAAGISTRENALSIGPAYQQVIIDPHHAIATRSLYDELGQLESKLETYDVDQIDQDWSHDLQSLHDRLNTLQQDLSP